MSQVLESFLTRFFRAPTKPGAHDYNDPGIHLTKENIAQVMASLTERQKRVLDEQSLQRLIPILDDERIRESYFRAVQMDRMSEVAGLKQLDPAARGRELVSWAILSGLLDNTHELFQETTTMSALKSWFYLATKYLRKLKYSLDQEQVRAILEACYDKNRNRSYSYRHDFLDIALEAIDANAKEWEFKTEDKQTFRDVIEHMSMLSAYGSTRRYIATLRAIVGTDQQEILWNGELWARLINSEIAGMPADQRSAWANVLTYAGTCNMTKPSKPWLKEAAKLLEPVQTDLATAQLLSWLRLFLKEPRESLENETPGPEMWRRYGLYSANTSVMVGLVWFAQLIKSPELLTVLADLAESVARLPQEARARSESIGAAAIRALTVDDDHALALLSRLELRIRWPKLKKLVKKQLDETIKRRGLDRSDVEETLVPDFGLRDGATVITFEGVSAEIRIGRSDKPSVTWKAADVKTLRTLTGKLKANNPGAGEQIKQVVADIEKMRAAQRTRLDLLMRRPRSWPMRLWRERYLDHGLIGSLARRLIWIAGDTPVLWQEDKLVDVHGAAQTISDEATVRMWHPAERPVDEVVAWRSAVESWQVVQPFKQAYREIYLLTDAERRTHTYSNRFAAHIVRAMTLLSISQVRQWKSGLFGGASSPSFELTDYGLRAEWWMQAAGDDYTPYGTPIYLATDQVRFLCTSEGAAQRLGYSGPLDQPIPLELVPTLAFSEIMRDVDLFAALSSVGNDPNWHDGGPEGRYADYWHRFSFGDLNESAKTRKAALERLVSRLAIRDQCRLDDKFLVVQGQIRTYKIHLGSGNILMEPNDQYLCIVPDRSSTKSNNDVFLPFEGDSTLSIILSKAFLLAEDMKITDPTITRQIKQ